MFPTSCPILGPRAEYYYNIPIYNYESGKINFPGLGSYQTPNGLHKIRISANSKDDPEGGFAEWILEVNCRNNPDEW